MRRDSSANMLIVMHIVGSHGPYYKRYSEQTWKMLAFDEKTLAVAEQAGDAERLQEYYASLLETDRFLQQVFERLDKLRGAPVVWVYISDHGENPHAGAGHYQDRFSWSMARIPLAVWCSQDWRERYPERFEVMKTNKDKIFTNDLLFDFYMGLAEIHFEDKSEQFDLSSRNYGLTSDGAVIIRGKYRIRDDPGVRLK
jgi:glucan phosphoethanolaminetransferase (alkaline phosphatase superfamily)